MKKTNLTLTLFLILGLMTGLILTELLASVKGIGFLTNAAEIYWHPKADFQVLKYDINLTIRLNLLCIAGMVGAFLIYRKL
ncbi:DUF4321 domain-containing protein [Gorillibacterium timonense]|uniref:DUF4321 domain-containing protein n=1 Tax=Gorillibacterium timonense TaxID=1689269 RepID=UPI00071D2B0B|nr:DUF4321 domain-containing protein [Gorillibacterium timonense]